MSYITIEFPERKEIRINGCDSVTLDQADVLRAIHGLPEAERLKFTAALLETHMNIQHFSVEDKKKVHDCALNLATRCMKNLIENDYKSALSGLTNINPGKEFLKSLQKVDKTNPSKFANRLESEILARKSENWPGSDKHTHDPDESKKNMNVRGKKAAYAHFRPGHTVEVVKDNPNADQLAIELKYRWKIGDKFEINSIKYLLSGTFLCDRHGHCLNASRAKLIESNVPKMQNPPPPPAKQEMRRFG